MKKDQDDYYEKKMAEASEMAVYFAYTFLGFVAFAILVGLYKLLSSS